MVNLTAPRCSERGAPVAWRYLGRWQHELLIQEPCATPLAPFLTGVTVVTTMQCRWQRRSVSPPTVSPAFRSIRRCCSSASPRLRATIASLTES